MKIQEEPLVSIIIPAYNVEGVIENCIKSVSIQTFNKIEIIIVDDGSCDGTYDVCYRLAEDDKRIKIIRQKNKGASAARNRGIQEAVGEFIVFVDADDTIMMNMVELLICKQKKYDADLVQSAIVHITDKKHERIFTDTIGHRYKNKDEIKKHFFEILDNGLNSPVGKLYKRSIISNNSILFDEQLEISEDLCFNLHYLEQIESMVYIPDILYKYYLCNSYLTKKYKNNLYDTRIRAIMILDNFLKRNGLERNKIYYLYIKLIFAVAMQDLEHNKKKRKDRFENINNNLKRIEVKEAIERFNPQGKIEKILYCVIRTRTPVFIDLMSQILIFVRKSNLLKIKRISV